MMQHCCGSETPKFGIKQKIDKGQIRRRIVLEKHLTINNSDKTLTFPKNMIKMLKEAKTLI